MTSSKAYPGLPASELIKVVTVILWSCGLPRVYATFEHMNQKLTASEGVKIRGDSVVFSLHSEQKLTNDVSGFKLIAFDRIDFCSSFNHCTPETFKDKKFGIFD